MKKKEDYLAGVSIFSQFNDKDLERLAKKSRYCAFKLGDVIIREGDHDRRLFILISGKADVIKSYSTRKQKHMRTLIPPSYFGEMALIDDLFRSATVVARGEVKTLCLSDWNLYQEIARYPQLAVELLQMLNRRLLAVEKALVNAIGGFIPICSNCKKIRDEEGSWMMIEDYIIDHTEHEFSHGVCPDCTKRLYG